MKRDLLLTRTFGRALPKRVLDVVVYAMSYLWMAPGDVARVEFGGVYGKGTVTLVSNEGEEACFRVRIDEPAAARGIRDYRVSREQLTAFTDALPSLEVA